MVARVGTLCDMGARDPLERLLDRCEWVGDCLVWQGGRVRGRYGQFRPGTRSTDPKVYVHVYVYEQTVGPIPEGHEVDHVRARGCSDTGCVNPAHLEAVTAEVNSERARLNTCRAGLHDLTDPSNCHWDSKGRRRGCLPCHRASALAHYYHRKAVA